MTQKWSLVFCSPVEGFLPSFLLLERSTCLFCPRCTHSLYSLAVVNCEEAESGQRRRSIEEWKKSSLLKNSIWALTLSQLQSENILPILSLGEFFAFTLGSVFNHETWLNSLLRSLAMYERTTTTLSLHVASTRFQHTNRVEQLLLLSPLLLLLSSSSSSTSSPSSSTCPLYTLLFSSSRYFLLLIQGDPRDGLV